MLAAVGNIMVLREATTLRFALALLAILGGIALVILNKSRSQGALRTAYGGTKKRG